MEAAAKASFEKWRARQQESLGWVPQADRSPATIKVKPMKRTIAHTDATEHAATLDDTVMTPITDDDNTVARGSDATERAATIEVMTTPAFDAATDHLLRVCCFGPCSVGPCRLRCMKIEHGMLCTMHEEIERRFRVPVSLEQLLQKYEHTVCDAGLRPTMQCKSWSGTIEAISRCIAAFQKAADATEHIQCQDIATKTCDYAIALAWKTPAYCGREDLLALVHQFMQNRTHNLAFIHLLNQSCLCEHEDDSFWSLVSDLEYVRITEGSQKEECLRIIELCMDAIKNHADHLQRQMEVYNTCNHI